MGDRCYVSMEISKNDWDKVNSIMSQYKNFIWYDEIDDTDTHYSTARIFDANYAYASEIDELVKAGITFMAFNEQGGDYSSAYTVAAAGIKLQVECNRDGDLCVVVNEDGTIDQERLEHIHRYQRLEKQVGTYIYKGKDQDFSWLNENAKEQSK